MKSTKAYLVAAQMTTEIWFCHFGREVQWAARIRADIRPSCIVMSGRSMWCWVKFGGVVRRAAGFGVLFQESRHQWDKSVLCRGREFGRVRMV